MRYYQNVNRPLENYVAPVDLQVAGNAYNTLQQGHIKALELESKLGKTIAELPLNESEEAFRQELFDGINSAIDANSVKGNAYYSIPALIKAEGNIAKNPELIGKLKAQQDYTNFINSVNANKELSSDEKEYYKAMNPYRNGDIIENGKKVGYDASFRWTPNKVMRRKADYEKIFQQGLKLAAEEVTNGQYYRWVDANGNPTANPMESFDGEIYYEVAGQKKVLSKDKIYQSVLAVANRDPYFNESIDQDRDVSEWKLGKNEAFNDENQEGINKGEVLAKYTYDDITKRADGSIMSRDEYIKSLFDKSAEVAAYTIENYKTSYGSGLKTYKAAEQAKQAAEFAAQFGSYNGSGIGGGYGNGNETLFPFQSQNPIGNVVIKTNQGQEATKNKNAALGNIQNTYYSLFGNLDESNVDTMIDRILSSEEVSPELKHSIKQQSRVYNESVNILNNIESKLNNKSSDKFKFGLKVTEGLPFDENDTKYDKRAVKIQNQFFKNGDGVIRIPNQNVLNDFISSSDKLIKDGIISYDGKETITIPKDNKNYLLQILDNLNTANLKYDSDLLGLNKLGVYLLPRNPKETKDFNTKSFIAKASRLYRQGKAFADEDSDIYYANQQEIEVPLESIADRSFADYTLRNAKKLGLTNEKRTEMDYEGKYAHERILDLAKTPIDKQYYNIFRRGEDGKFRLIEDENEFSEVVKSLNTSATNNKLNGLPVSADLAYSPLNDLGGYFFSIRNKDGEETDQIYIPGFGENEARDIIYNNPAYQAKTNITDVTKNKVPRIIMDNRELNTTSGNISIYPVEGDSDSVEVVLGNHSVVLDKQNAVNLTSVLFEFRDIYDKLSVGYPITQQEANSVNNYIIPTIANYFNLSKEIVDEALDLNRLISY